MIENSNKKCLWAVLGQNWTFRGQMSSRFFFVSSQKGEICQFALFFICNQQDSSS